jgi:hypothetical protein
MDHRLLRIAAEPSFGPIQGVKDDSPARVPSLNNLWEGRWRDPSGPMTEKINDVSYSARAHPRLFEPPGVVFGRTTLTSQRSPGTTPETASAIRRASASASGS